MIADNREASQSALRETKNRFLRRSAIIVHEFLELKVYENAVDDHQQQLFVPRHLHYTATVISRNKMTELDVSAKEEGRFEVMAEDASENDAKFMELIIQFPPIYDKSAKESHDKRRKGSSL